MVRTYHTFDVIIIGAGTAGLSAMKAASRHTDNILLIHDGPPGTTCARTGCMPTKALVHAADFYHKRLAMKEAGIKGAEHLQPDIPRVLENVREKRDEFVHGVVDGMKQFEHALVKGRAKFESPTKIRVGTRLFHTKASIVATGSTPIIPKSLEGIKPYLITSDTLFEQKDLPPRMAVIGLGPLGLEMAQALARLGINITAIHNSSLIGGISDPDISEEILSVLQKDMEVWLNAEAKAGVENGEVVLTAEGKTVRVDKVLVAAGRQPNIGALGLKRIGAAPHDKDVPKFDPLTMQIPGQPIYIVGDATDERAILHEAADEGKRAGYYAATGDKDALYRKVNLSIVFSHPNVAVVGDSAHALRHNGIVVGEASFETQGRAVIEQQNRGKIRLFANKGTGLLRGCEMMAPEGEHLAHLLALAMQERMTVADMLKMPFYHPTVEEGVRTALRDLHRQLHGGGGGESRKDEEENFPVAEKKRQSRRA